ncbi:MAG: 2-hydroxychromene-2-carboxylate isomerase [Thermoleophilaceae bacterium]
MTEQPVFYYDLGSPYAYLAAERVNHVLPVVPIWQPILLGGIWRQTGGGSWSVTGRRPEGMAEVERRAHERRLQPIRWPEPWPTNTTTAMRAATYAQQGGRAVAFSLAAFRQAFAGGRDLSVTDNVLIAAAACELHPRAVLKAIETRSVKDRLCAATEQAAARGVVGVPTLAIGEELFWGDDRLEEAASRLRAVP